MRYKAPTYQGNPCKHGHDGLRYSNGGACVHCMLAHSKRQREANPNHTANLRAWRKANAGYVKADNAKRYAANRVRVAKHKHERRLANIEEARAREVAYARSREWVDARNRRARVRGAEGSHTPDDIRRIRERQNDTCGMCPTVLNGGGHVDHVTPLSRGGSNWPSNLQLLCQPCNLRKADRDPAELALVG